MDEIQGRLMKCFQLVFPELPDAEIHAASQSSVPEWDSVASITLLNVIEDEFQITMDLERAAEFDSFQRIEDYLQGRISAV
ncbi:MAG TPA: acyl carrier protein [Bryobacteraceae bacterium]